MIISQKSQSWTHGGSSATLKLYATEPLTITVTGAALGDTVSIGVPNGSVTTDTLFWEWVSAADAVTVRATRISGTPDPASETSERFSYLLNLNERTTNSDESCELGRFSYLLNYTGDRLRVTRVVSWDDSLIC